MTANTEVQQGGELPQDERALSRAIDCLEILNKRPRPMCRDCADECGICPSSGLDCDMRQLISGARAAIAQRAASVPAPDAAAKPDCWCSTCRPVTMDDCRMVLCPTCGNKRCPRATDHRLTCSGSNEPGQVGSAYAGGWTLPGETPP